ncbi:MULTISPECIES: TonB-dependent siderophore receptor [unclassified Acinetobacter]|uniref:TonB-dependent siderophore receptor n=1 Tax=unclassified Acinetobacter TaxID=196816 RepID=UPI002934C935|nr:MULTISPECIES: TonB-dependent siderophore receptor [unclassified Acinetobacter]WOE32462.1 TonB-dependent siderophore receptor [Acinetobacter sp. SAAs470]WOE37937.1 TonB-dependent siderophore receptor [Acinetobacter sp. SAAs474]
MKHSIVKTHLHLAIHGILIVMPFFTSLGISSTLYADDKVIRRYTIAAGSLQQVLEQFAVQSHLSLSYKAQDLDQKQSMGLNQNYPIDQALAILLQPHQLQATKLANGGYSIDKIMIADTARPLTTSDIIQLSPIIINASERTEKSIAGTETTASDQSVQQLATLVIQADQGQLSHIGKSAQSLKEIPHSVTVMSRERIDQQGLKTLDDVMQQTTGVTRQQLWLNNNYSARGLKIENIRYDGGSASSLQDRNNAADMAQYESVELLRGADGLFGAGEAGGVINLRSKRPKTETELMTTLSAGSWNNYRGEIDITGPLSSNIQGRFVTVLQDQDFFYKPTHNRREMFYAALNFDLLPSTTLFTGISYQHDKTDAFNASLPRWEDGADLNLARSTTLGAPWGWIKRENISLFANLQHEINDDWKTQLNIRHNIGNDAINGAEMEGAVSYDTYESQWWRYQDDTHFKETTVDLNLQGNFNLFEQKHDVILGIDHSNHQKDYKQNWTYYANGNIFNPIYPPEWDYPPATWNINNTNKQTNSALYGSLRLHATDQLSLTIGGRYHFHNQFTIVNHNTHISDRYTEEKKFIPYYAISYDISPDMTLYSSFAKIFKNQRNYLVATNGPGLEPLIGRNFEVGLKYNITDNTLFSVAYFDIKKEKEAVYSSRATLPNSNSACCYVGTGSMQSRGLDIELNGNITPEWHVALGYTYNQNEKKDNTENPYNTYTPRNLIKLWTNYQLNQFVEGLEIGAGVTAQSKNYAVGQVQEFNPATGKYDSGKWVSVQIVQPQYAIWSARIAYDLNPQWNIALNLNNIFDKTYYSTIGYPGYNNFYGEPRNFMLTLKGKY